MLHHNYLQIEHEGKTLQLPVRCAKLIKDMYNARNAKNENDDLAHYSKDGFENPPYEVSVMLMNAGYDSELQWITKKINPIEGKKNDKR